MQYELCVGDLGLVRVRSRASVRKITFFYTPKLIPDYTPLRISSQFYRLEQSFLKPHGLATPFCFDLVQPLTLLLSIFSTSQLRREPVTSGMHGSLNIAEYKRVNVTCNASLRAIELNISLMFEDNDVTTVLLY